MHDPAVLVDASTTDDAAVYRLDDGRAVVATVDYFTPIVDDPYDFGRIAATNALSDIYAMGATPRFALNLVGFPRELLDRGILGEIVRGGGEAARAAGVPVIGGHSLDSPEPTYGMCVIGDGEVDALVRNSTAEPGDRLVLTKPIGTGVIATAIKADAADPAAMRAAVESMTTLNRGAAEAMLRVGVHAATDVTGFGLLGHLRELALASGLAATIRASAVPLLPSALDLAAADHVPGGTRRNRDDLRDHLRWADDLPDPLRTLLCDAQTSGGLLIALAPDHEPALLDALDHAAAPAAASIGELRAGPAGEIAVER